MSGLLLEISPHLMWVEKKTKELFR
jgi:hypothetical protein